jgi:TM2 domain-containing membrane protein YozV
VGLALLAGFVLAQTPDRLKPQPMSVDTTPKVDTVRSYRPAKSPGTAVLLSFLLPGAGQIYTGNWWKAALIAPAEVTLGYLSVKEHLSATESLRDGDTVNYVRHGDARTAFLWWTGAVVAFSMADAYVSAQMYGFDREIRFTVGPIRAGIAMEF